MTWSPATQSKSACIAGDSTCTKNIAVPCPNHTAHGPPPTAHRPRPDACCLPLTTRLRLVTADFSPPTPYPARAAVATAGCLGTTATATPCMQPPPPSCAPAPLQPPRATVQVAAQVQARRGGGGGGCVGWS